MITNLKCWAADPKFEKDKIILEKLDINTISQ